MYLHSVAYGYRRLHPLLCREGWPVNHQRIQRIYRDEGLTQQRKRPKRRRSAAPRVVRLLPGAANERWAMDFIHDQLADGTAPSPVKLPVLVEACLPTLRPAIPGLSLSPSSVDDSGKFLDPPDDGPPLSAPSVTGRFLI